MNMLRHKSETVDTTNDMPWEHRSTDDITEVATK